MSPAFSLEQIVFFCSLDNNILSNKLLDMFYYSFRVVLTDDSRQNANIC